MTRKIIRVGTTANDGTGDSLRETANKINYNFGELYTALGLTGCGDYSLNIAPPCGSDVLIQTCGIGKITVDSSTTIQLKTGVNSNLNLDAGNQVVSTTSFRLNGNPATVGIYFADGTFQNTAGGGSGSTYTLPTAAANTLGGVKVGSGLAVDGSGVLSVQYAYNLPNASTNTLGGIKVGYGLTINGAGVLSVVDGNSFSLVDGAAGTFLRTNGSGNYTFQALPIATGSTLGVIKVGQNLTIAQDGTLNANPVTYTLPKATANTLGGIRVGQNLIIDANGILSTVPIPNDLTDLNIADGNVNQFLTTDGNGHFYFDDVVYADVELDDLTDVFLTTPTANEVLKYDGAKWVNGVADTGPQALDDLTDVVITNVATNNVLKYNGTNWVNGAAAAANPFDQDLNTFDQVEFVTTTADQFILSGSGTPTVSSDTDLYLEAIGGKVSIISKSPFRLARFTTAERNALTTAENGDTIYNTTTNKFQGYANGAWVDLH